MLSIIMPIYNEKNTLRQIFERVNQLTLSKEIIMVDDFSIDGTREMLEEFKLPNVKILYHDKNMGKGAAIRTALKVVSGDMVVIQDADLEYNPEEIPVLAKIIERGEADVVYGSRFLGEHAREYISLMYLGNRFLSLLTSIVFGHKVTDMETCYKVFKADVIKSFDLRANRFDFEPEVTAKVLKRKIRFREVPISYKGRSYRLGKKIGWRDGIMAVFTILKFRVTD